MRMPRILEPDVWYKISAAVNRHEPIFLAQGAVDFFNRILCETGELFPCEVRHLNIEPDRVSFYIKPDDGLQLPEIMQWIKQTYSVRYNMYDGRTGHIWGDRYASRIAAEGPPKDAEEYVFGPVICKAGCGGAGRARAEADRKAVRRPPIRRPTPRAAPARGKRPETTVRHRVSPIVPPLRTAKRP
jgi:REP element-mobilizing transposase RayT